MLLKEKDDSSRFHITRRHTSRKNADEKENGGRERQNDESGGRKKEIKGERDGGIEGVMQERQISGADMRSIISS